MMTANIKELLQPNFPLFLQLAAMHRVLSVSLREMIFRGWYHIRRQQHYLMRMTNYEKPIEIEFAG